MPHYEKHAEWRHLFEERLAAIDPEDSEAFLETKRRFRKRRQSKFSRDDREENFGKEYFGKKDDSGKPDSDNKEH